MTVQDLFFSLPLYQKIKLDKTHSELISDFFHYTYQIEGYNPSIGENTSFIIRRNRHFGTVTSNYEKYNGFHNIELVCVRTQELFKYFFILQSIEIEEDIYESSLVKIGQYPSLADLEFSKLNKFSKVIDKPSLHEIKKAVGLAANGVGIGSYVYLRRVFENLIESKHQKSKILQGWDEAAYQAARMDDKILILKDHLPTILVSHRSIYGIVSKGIHELSENECLAYFQVLLDAIVMMLEEEFKLKEEEKRLADMKANLAKIHQDLKKS
ncbi:hypothetical protein WH221_07805 [Chryseobacterium culicis]|uniref:Uncharacterized protein n=1 Tax=Chryseobacterium culicis TaxID=680127 RepID=A0A2S9D059_CHRCI|nr:hypothetical protein [Chryseobacterium culicis]PRB86139.1 hypothetical protein CQ022_07785 [Chryseobacterium culicis]PRB91892.1 hypothetical protein CQ033_01455 [Chryseobacterium culicis]